MGQNFTQEDSTDTTCGEVQACAASATAISTADRVCTVSGTAGTTEITGLGDIDSGLTRSVIMFECAPDETDWASGTAVVRIDVTTGNMQMAVEAVYLCQRSSACGAKDTYGSLTGIGQGINIAQVYSFNVTCSSITALASDLLYIVVEFSSGAGMNQTCGITPSQIIDTPIVAPSVGKTATGSFSLPVPTVAGVAVLTGLRTATGSFSIPVPTLAGVGEAGEKTATGSFSLPIPTIAGVGEAGEKTATGSFALPVPTLAGVAEAGEKTATGAFSLPVPTLAGVGAIPVGGDKTATGSFSIPIPTLAGVAEAGEKTATGSFSLPVPTVAGVAVLTGLRTATGAFSLPVPTIAGVAEAGEKTATGAFSIPLPTISGVGEAGEKTATGSFALPVPTVAGVALLTGLRTATGSFSLPVPTIAGVAEAGEKTATGAFSLPVPTLAGVAEAGEKTSTGAFSLPIPTIAGVGDLTGLRTATGSFLLPVPTLAGVAEAGEKTATGTFSLPVPTLAGVGDLVGSKSATGAFALPVPTVSGHGVKSAICDRKYMTAIDMDGNEIKGARWPVETISSTDTLDNTHEYVLADAAGGAFTLTLPAVATSSGKRYRITKMNSNANAITIDGNASETINGVTTLDIIFQYDSLEIICNGTEWVT